MGRAQRTAASRGGGLTAWVGVALLVAATTRSAGWQPSSIDPDDPLPCALRGGDGCPTDVAAASAALWWWSLVPVAIVLVGAVVSAAGRSPEPVASDGEPSVALHLGAAGAGVLVLSTLGAVPLTISALVSPHTELVVVVVGWLVVAWFLRVVDGAIGPHGVAPRRRALDALGVAAMALAVWTWWAHTSSVGLPGVAAGGAVVGLVVVAGTAVALLLRGRAGRVATVALSVVGVLGMATAVGLVVATRPPDVVPAAAPAVPTPTPTTPTPTSPPVPTPGPEPVPTASPTGVATDVPCTTSDLAFTVGGFDAAMGARAASVIATNAGTTDCLLVGTPTVTLLQGGQPLQLTVEPGRDRNGNPAVTLPIGLAPGEAAFVFLGWRTYGGWADAQTPQSVTVDLGGGPVPAALPAALGPAPFDIADGGAWEVAPWALLVR